VHPAGPDVDAEEQEELAAQGMLPPSSGVVERLMAFDT
jgi:hypothetical protein